MAQVLRGPTTEASVKLAWLRVLLSSPIVFIRRVIYDDKYAEANSLREDILGTGAAVEETIRQLCLNISGFKLQKFNETGLAMTAGRMADFLQSAYHKPTS